MGNHMTLDEIGLKTNTDKASIFHNFLNFYEQQLTLDRSSQLKILEIGVYDGASLAMWSDYYYNSHVIGVDINPDCLKYRGERKEVVIADQSNIDHLSKIVYEYGPFDLIVDDGSHIWDHQITTLQYLFPSVRSGGFYILEDIDTSYGSYIKDYRRLSSISAADYIKKLMDYMIGDRVLDISTEADAFVRTYARQIESVCFYRRTSILKKI